MSNFSEQDEQMMIRNYMAIAKTKAKCFWCLKFYRETGSKRFDLITKDQEAKFMNHNPIEIETIKQCGYCGEICMFVHKV